MTIILQIDNENPRFPKISRIDLIGKWGVLPILPLGGTESFFEDENFGNAPPLFLDRYLNLKNCFYRARKIVKRFNYSYLLILTGPEKSYFVTTQRNFPFMLFWNICSANADSIPKTQGKRNFMCEIIYREKEKLSHSCLLMVWRKDMNICYLLQFNPLALLFPETPFKSEKNVNLCSQRIWLFLLSLNVLINSKYRKLVLFVRLDNEPVVRFWTDYSFQSKRSWKHK